MKRVGLAIKMCARMCEEETCVCVCISAKEGEKGVFINMERVLVIVCLWM